MIERYQTEEMKKIWSEENKYQTWLEIEILASEAWSQVGKVPVEAATAIRKKAMIDSRRVLEIEEETRHDVVAFTRAVSESLGDEKKWVHYGLTSTDVVDTANGVRLKEANTVLEAHLQTLMSLIKEEANRYRYTLCMGRTHGIHAELTTFGLKLAGFYDELHRHMTRFQAVRHEVEVGELSGAVGTFSAIPMSVEAYVCEQLGLTPQPITTQVLPRDLYAHYISVLALMATSIERFATEWRHLQRTEVQELEEGFGRGQKGSSAMPHKRNPISAENLCGLARMMRGYLIPAFEDVNLWHERDISHSSVERMMLPEATTLLDYMLQRLTRMIQNWHVREDKMMENIERTKGLIYSQYVLLALIDKGLSREDAYDMIQPLAMQAFEAGTEYKPLLMKSEDVRRYLSEEELNECFNPEAQLKEVDAIFHRVGL